MLEEKIPDKCAKIAYTLNSDTKQPVNKPEPKTNQNEKKKKKFIKSMTIEKDTEI